MKNKLGETIKLNHICKVEGHADLHLEIKDNKITKCELGAVEGARLFEGLVVGRKWDELKEITSRICGICSVAHSMTSIKAVEDAFGIKVTEQTKILRDLMAMGERIRSHATHLYMLSLPDFVGCESAIEMAPKYKKELERALRLIKLGNEIIIKTSGRQMHPVASIVGGFTKIPDKQELKELAEELEKRREDAMETLRLFLSLKYPEINREVEHICVKQEKQLPLLNGIIISDKGLRVEPGHYEELLEEYTQPYSTAKFVVKDGKKYYLGALARINLGWNELAEDVKKEITKAGYKFPSKNTFHNLIAQAAELVHWVDQASKIIKNYEFKPEEPIKIKPRAGKGSAVTEAPRGLLFHTYEFDEEGTCTACNIMTPTSQYLKCMEEDIKDYVQKLINEGKKKEEIIFEIERLIRAYDPCFSCSAHFLEVQWDEK